MHKRKTARALCRTLGICLAAATALAGGAGSLRAADAQFEKPFDFTPRDRRVAIAVAIKQVQDGLLGPSRITSVTNIEQNICSGPSGTANAAANFFCEIVRGNDNQIGDRDQASIGDQTATSITSTDSTVTQSSTRSGVDGIAAALNGRF
ncbi:MAG: hypothetical protein ACK4QW_15445 [Alphaproteobacteria bacterium]